MSIKIEKQNGKPKISFVLGIWTVIAAMISYMVNHSIWWAILHGLFGIYYIAYFGVRHWQEILYAITWFINQCAILLNFLTY